MGSEFEICSVNTLLNIRGLRNENKISDEQFEKYKSLIIKVLHNAGEYYLWNDEKLARLLGHNYIDSVEELQNIKEENSLDTIHINLNVVYNLGKRVVIDDSNPYYFIFLAIQLAASHTMYFKRILDFHFRRLNIEHSKFIENLKVWIWENPDNLLSSGQIEAIKDWISNKRIKKSESPSLKGSKNLLSILNNPNNFKDNICKKLLQHKDENGNFFVNEIRDQRSSSYIFTWNTEGQLLAALHEHLCLCGYVDKYYLNQNCAEYYCQFFNYPHSDGIKRQFAKKKRKEIYSFKQKLFSFIS